MQDKYTLTHIPHTHIDAAWREGANCLAEACDISGGEITGDQLKMMLSRNERSLLKMQEGATIRGWAVIRIDQLPNMRVLFITDLVAHNSNCHKYLDAISDMGNALGCSRIRCSAGPAQERLYRAKCDFAAVYTIMEKVI